MSVTVGKTLSIRESGFDEYWLQDQIFDNPSCLNLGELEGVEKEKRQSSGGRLDILLKNSDDDSMYEVEVMLGETDESHIIRTIEYWDNERRRWPQRQHYAVIIAEKVTRRFFNVIQLLSQTIPIIAIQANIIEAAGQKILNFVTVLDTYEEIDDGTTILNERADAAFWKKKAPWVIESMDYLEGIFREKNSEVTRNHARGYISLSCFGKNRLWLQKRSGNKIYFKFNHPETVKDEISELLDNESISFVQKKGRSTRLTTSLKEIQNHQEVFHKIFDVLIESWR